MLYAVLIMQMLLINTLVIFEKPYSMSFLKPNFLFPAKKAG